jgi:hypothetical protein
MQVKSDSGNAMFTGYAVFRAASAINNFLTKEAVAFHLC